MGKGRGSNIEAKQAPGKRATGKARQAVENGQGDELEALLEEEPEATELATSGSSGAGTDRSDEEASEELEEDEFAESDVDPEPGANMADEESAIDDFDGDLADGEEDIDAVVALSAKDQSARSLEVRRAIEERMEKRRLDEDLDYLDLDFED